MTPLVALLGGAAAIAAALGVAWPFLREARPVGSPEGDGAPPIVEGPTGVGLAAVLGALALAASLLAAGALGEEPALERPGRGVALDAVSYFEGRVAERPRDPAARLDLADAYLEAGRAESAVEQYVRALELEPRLPEAHARLGLILSASGRHDEGLEAVDRALEMRPGYPEALYARGLILAQGLDRPLAAARTLRAYLDASPFGAYREQAMRMLERLDRA